MTTVGTNYFTNQTTNVQVALTDDFGNAMLAKGTAANAPSAVAGYAIGCEYIATDTGARYYNTGSATSATFTLVGTVTAGSVAGADLVTEVGYFTVSKATNGTTPVDVIGATVPFDCVITGAYLSSLDTTAGNITIEDTAGSVAVIAKGTVAGVLVGAGSLTNTTVTAGDTLTIVSSSAGNARVYITYTVA